MHNPSSDYAILFVDDEEMARKYFTKAYSKDFYILTAENVADAKDVLEKHSDEIGVLITDQRMPGEPGVALLEFVRQQHPHIVRLLTTAYSDLEDAIKAVNSGEILRYIVKPWDIKSLHTELRNALRFFYMQNERDQLLREKLSVWQRMTEVNRVRDLLVMSGGLSNVERPLDAIRMLLLQAPVTVELFSDEKSLEMWGLLEDEVRNVLSLSETLVADINQVLASDGPAQVVPLLQSISSNRPQTRLTVPNDIPQPIISESGLEKILSCMVNYLDDSASEERVEISISARQREDGLGISLTTSSADGANQYTATPGLMLAFYLTAHFGGNLTLVKDNNMGAELLLPLTTGQVLTPEANDYWLDELFAQYEG